MAVPELKLIGAYNTWADNTVLRLSRQLSAEQLRADHSMGFGSVFNTLVHTMSAERAWVTRWLGKTPAAMAKGADYRDLDQLEADWSPVHSELEAFFDSLTPERYNAPVTYKTFAGAEYTDVMSVLVWHLINHSTEHRAQVAAVCTQAGIVVGDLNIIHFLRL